MNEADRLYLDFKGARERLCRSQTELPQPEHRRMLQDAIDNVDRVAAFYCPQWSSYDLPTTELDGGPA